MIIRFRPGKLRMKPDALTRRWNIYLKEGGSDYGTINPQNLRPIFTTQQLSESLRATSLLIPALCASVLMDSEQLHADILAHLSSDLWPKNTLESLPMRDGRNPMMVSYDTTTESTFPKPEISDYEYSNTNMIMYSQDPSVKIKLCQ